MTNRPYNLKIRQLAGWHFSYLLSGLFLTKHLHIGWMMTIVVLVMILKALPQGDFTSKWCLDMGKIIPMQNANFTFSPDPMVSRHGKDNSYAKYQLSWSLPHASVPEKCSLYVELIQELVLSPFSVVKWLSMPWWKRLLLLLTYKHLGQCDVGQDYVSWNSWQKNSMRVLDSV